MTLDQDKQITIKNLDEKLSNALDTAGNPKDISVQWNIFIQHLAYCLSNYDKLDSEAQKRTDNLNEQIIALIEEQLPLLPDTIETRKLKRYTRGAKGKRLLAKIYTDILENPTDAATTPVLYKKSRELFEKHLQIIMDLYQDISGHSLNGVSTFCKLNLLGVCIDELLVAFHLAQRSYAGQAFSHIRTIQESLDLIELFNKEPKLADLWTSDKPSKEIWEKLRPSKVRNMLGKDEIFRKIYSLLSGVGTHPSFEMLRTRCRMVAGLSPKGNRHFSISAGGKPKSREALFAHVFVHFSMAMILAQLIHAFGEFLNESEAVEVLENMSTDFGNFYSDFFVKPLKDAGKDMSARKKAILDMKNELFRNCGG